jgi:hypothetical protein
LQLSDPGLVVLHPVEHLVAELDGEVFDLSLGNISGHETPRVGSSAPLPRASRRGVGRAAAGHAPTYYADVHSPSASRKALDMLLLAGYQAPASGMPSSVRAAFYSVPGNATNPSRREEKRNGCSQSR